MVIAKARRTGNWMRWNCIASLLVEKSFIFGMQTADPANVPVWMVASIRLRISDLTIRRVPLHKPFIASRFLSSITGAPTFSLSS